MIPGPSHQRSVRAVEPNDCTRAPPTAASRAAVSVAIRIRERVAEHAFLETDGLEVRLTASVGVATLPDVAASAEELIRAADKAMYRVKAAGKDGIHVATESE